MQKTSDIVNMASIDCVDKNININAEVDDCDDNIEATHISPIDGDLHDGTPTNIPGIITLLLIKIHRFEYKELRK